MKRVYFTSIALLFLFVCILDVGVVSSRVLYDDFLGININEQKWKQTDNMPLDIVRKVIGGELVSKAGNSTDIPNVRNPIIFKDPSTINIIQCDISVDVANLDTGTNAKSIARINGRFYNTIDGGTQDGDVYAGLFIGNRGGGIEAWWEVWEEQDVWGGDFELQGNGTVSVPTPGLQYGNVFTAKLEYDGVNTFTFTVAGGSDTFIGPDKAGAEFIPYKALETSVAAEGGSGTGYTSATFDNVILNNGSRDGDVFSSAPLNPEIWQNTEFVREVENGNLRLTAHSEGNKETTGIEFAGSSPYIEATVIIKDESFIGADGRGRFKLHGNFYNDTNGPGSGNPYDGYIGDVYAMAVINYTGDGVIQASCYAERVNDANWEYDGQELLNETFNIPIIKERPYTLSIQLTDTKLIFTCKDTVTEAEESYEYLIPTNTYMPFEYNKSTYSRVDRSESKGYMAVEIEDVYAEAATYDSSGDMLLTITDIWGSEDCGDPPELPVTLDTILEQNGNDFTLIIYDFFGDDEEGMFNGIVHGETYAFESAEFGDFTRTINSQFMISQDGSGLGLMKTHEFYDGIECRELAYFSVNIKDVDKDGYDSTMYGGDDCDDNNPLIFPDAEEICGDNMDNNCDGQVDEDCSVLCGDVNGDGFVNRIDIKTKFRELQNEYNTWLNECWEPKDPCGDIDGNGRVNWRDRVKKFSSILNEYFSWLQECWKPQRD